MGWAVAGGVIAGAAAGYGVYKVVESKAGQDMIDGVTQLDKNKIERGLGEGRSALVDATISAGPWLAGHFNAAHE